MMNSPMLIQIMRRVRKALRHPLMFPVVIVACFLLTLLATHAHAVTLASPPVPGSFDASFGSGTGRILRMAVTADGPDAMTSISPHSGEKVLLAGYCVAVRTRFCIARFNSSGELDQTFVGDNGDSGKFTINVPEWRYAAGLYVVSQRDGKILIAGVCEAGLGQFSFCVMRLLADGRVTIPRQSRGLSML